MEFARKGEFYVMTSQKQGSYTIADIDALPEGQRAELIDGRMYMMASPALSHQDILIWLSVEIFNYIKSQGQMQGCPCSLRRVYQEGRSELFRT